MADYSMTDEKWSKNVTLVENHIKNNDVGDMKVPLEWHIAQGNENPEFRKRYWNSITNMFATVENSPIIPGRARSHPQFVQDSVSAICAVYAQDARALFVSHPLYGEILRARGKAGYEKYADAESYAASVIGNLETRLYGYYTNYTQQKDGLQWDGKLDKNGVPKIKAQTPEVEG